MGMRVKKRFVLSAVLSLYALLTSVYLGPAHAQELDKSAWPTKEWLTSTPEEQGMDSSALAKLVAFGGSHSFDSLLVVRHGRIVLDAYYAPYTADIPHEIHSSTKAVLSTLLGMIYKDGSLDRLDRPVLDFFADRHVANVDDRKKAITIQNLLDMTSGFDWDQGIEGGKEQSLIDQERSSNRTQFILDRPMAHAPGEVFNYSDANPELLSAIITKLTGKLAEDYAREKLFGPLGIATWHWDRDPQGLTMGAWTLTLLPRDMAKIGYLYLHHGEWEGRSLLPPGWADVLSHTTVNMHASFDPNLRYSNFFWAFPERHVYMAVGWHGQLIAVFPDLDIVAVVTARSFFGSAN
jgi:CubicO group peptidase (beta-lactamase class C family)